MFLIFFIENKVKKKVETENVLAIFFINWEILLGHLGYGNGTCCLCVKCCDSCG